MVWLLLGNAFKPVDHTEHHSHRHEADAQEDRPSHPNGAGVVDQRADPEQKVADGGSTEPKALTEALKVLWSHLGNEAQAKRRDEEFCDGKEEIKHEEHPRAGLPCFGFSRGKCLEGFGGGDRKSVV